MDPDGNRQELELVEGIFREYLTQRGNGLSFEVVEGMVFASWVESTSRIEDIERVGADGMTNYLDGFDVEFSGEDGAAVRISGESEWVFEDDNYDSGQICEGITHWEATRSRSGPDTRGAPPRLWTKGFKASRPTSPAPRRIATRFTAWVRLPTRTGSSLLLRPRNENSFGASESTVAPVARNAHPFTLLPPSSPSGSAGLVFSRIFFRPTPRERPIGELTGTRLEFNKAAWAGSAYLEFTAAMGLPAP